MPKESEELERKTGVADISKDDIDHPVISSWYDTLPHVAEGIQPSSSSYEAAQRILDAVKKGDPPDEIDMDDVGEVFHAADLDFKRVVIK